MNLCIISQCVNTGYATYSEAVVAAESEEEAKTIHPNGFLTLPGVQDEDGDYDWRYSSSWTPHLKDVSAKLIGKAVKGTVKGVVLASYHAG